MAKNNKWTLENCKIEAKKYNRIIEWIENSSSSYQAARYNKWIEKCTNHMLKRKKWVLESCKLEAKKYNRITEWKKNSSASYYMAYRKKWVNKRFRLKRD